MKTGIGKLILALAALAVCGAAAVAQVQVGENTSMNLSGNLTAGYSGSYGDTIDSSHGLNFGGNGNLTGSYFNPKFLNFNIQPYYNRSQNNSSFQSITNSSGVNASANLFSGSRFPGAVSYARSFDSSGQFGVPGINGFTTHGNSDAFGVTWSALIPKYPTLTASYTTSNSDFEVFGANSNSHNTNRNFSLISSYSLAGFRLNGGYYRQTMNALFPSLFTGEAAQSSGSTTNQYTLQTSHSLPLQGQWFFGWTHSNFGGDYVASNDQKGGNTGALNILNSGVVVNPISRLNLSFVSTYNTNVFGTIQQQVLQSGGSISQLTSNSDSKALTLDTTAYFRLTNHIGLNGNIIRLNQYFPDHSIGTTQYGGGVNANYAFKWLGSLNFSLGAVDTATQQGNTGAVMVANVNFARRFGRWETGGSFAYSQQVQTLLADYVTSVYNYSANVRRRFLDLIQWTGAYYGSHSGLTRTDGDNNFTHGFYSNFVVGHLGINGTYSRSGGTSILTSQGLVNLPNIPPELIQEQILYNADSYGVGGAFTIKRASLTFNYAHASSDTHDGNPTNFETKLMNARLQWRLRKLWINGGYTKLDQGFLTSTGFRPTAVNTFYIGISRWFNVF